MKNNNYLYTIGQFAKLNDINKRTLHYYDEIDLFSPEFKADNGYRYYTCFQTVELELIITLRRIGLSIEEIKKYICDRSETTLATMISEKKEIIDKSIQKLFEAKSFLERKSEKLALGLKAEHGKIEIKELPQEKLLISEHITGRYDDDDFSVATDFSLRLKNIFGLYDNFGSRISAENIKNNIFNEYDCFFAYNRQSASQFQNYFDEIRPKGKYLQAYCIGDWQKIKDVYEKINKFVYDNSLEIYGYAYEEGLNEMSLKSRDDYITLITIGIKE